MKEPLMIGGHHIFVRGSTTISVLPNGYVLAVPEDNEEYRERAISLGYGERTARMSLEHEITHALLAKWLGLHVSPTLHGVAVDRKYKHWQKEEAAILAIQAFANAAGIDLMELAEMESR